MPTFISFLNVLTFVAAAGCFSMMLLSAGAFLHTMLTNRVPLRTKLANIVQQLPDYAVDMRQPQLFTLPGFLASAMALFVICFVQAVLTLHLTNAVLALTGFLAFILGMVMFARACDNRSATVTPPNFYAKDLRP